MTGGGSGPAADCAGRTHRSSCVSYAGMDAVDAGPGRSVCGAPLNFPTKNGRPLGFKNLIKRFF